MCRKGEVTIVAVPVTIVDDIVTKWGPAEIDSCLVDAVNALNKIGAYTKATCCGHFEIPGCILLQDGTMIHLPVLEKK